MSDEGISFMRAYVKPIPEDFIFDMEKFSEELDIIFENFDSLIDDKRRTNTHFIDRDGNDAYTIEVHKLANLPHTNFLMEYEEESLMSAIREKIYPRRLSGLYSFTLLFCISKVDDDYYSDSGSDAFINIISPTSNFSHLF